MGIIIYNLMKPHSKKKGQAPLKLSVPVFKFVKATEY